MSTNLLSYYNEKIKSNPLLTKDQEIELGRRIKSGDHNARLKMIESNYRLVIKIAKKYHKPGLDFSELISESQIGLMKAVDRYDYEKGFKFSTYACWWIKQALMQYINDTKSIIKTPSNNRNIFAKAKQIRNEINEKFGYVPSNEEISDILGISLTTLNNVESLNVSVTSIEEKFDNGDKEGRRVIEKIVDTSSDIESNLLQDEMKDMLFESLKLLSPREEKILRLRFGLFTSDDDIENFPITFSELADLASSK
jgi:RNA polymerase primary sigma factor